MAALTRWSALAIGLSVSALLTACASPADTGAAPPAADASHDCQGTPVPASALKGEPSLDELTPAGREAVASASYEGVDPLGLGADDGWFVVSESGESIVLLRSVDPGTAGPEGPRGDQELITIGYIADAPNLDPGWYVTQHTLCSLRVSLGSLTAADVVLDAATPVDPGSREVALLVTERECNSGQDAAGRIRVVRLLETETTIEFVLGVEPRGGDQACPENPATPFVLELAAPVGGRTLIDAALLPARTLHAGAGS